MQMMRSWRTGRPTWMAGKDRSPIEAAKSAEYMSAAEAVGPSDGPNPLSGIVSSDLERKSQNARRLTVGTATNGGCPFDDLQPSRGQGTVQPYPGGFLARPGGGAIAVLFPSLASTNPCRGDDLDPRRFPPRGASSQPGSMAHPKNHLKVRRRVATNSRPLLLSCLLHST